MRTRLPTVQELATLLSTHTPFILTQPVVLHHEHPFPATLSKACHLDKGREGSGNHTSVITPAAYTDGVSGTPSGQYGVACPELETRRVGHGCHFRRSRTFVQIGCLEVLEVLEVFKWDVQRC